MPDNNRANLVAICGAGPAGLTAALELLRHTQFTPIVFDVDGQVGGISKTVAYRGNRMDLGGHRFFSKSDWVMNWWEEILPVAANSSDSMTPLRMTYQGKSRQFDPNYTIPANADAVMLIRERLSRIFYRRRFFDYPLKVSAATLKNIGVIETCKIGLSYGLARAAPIKPEHSLEDFLINRFGDRLYRTFFRDYTEKVWGVHCREISADWGAQRIKGLSVAKAVMHALTGPFRRADTSQKKAETSLIERFLYPKFGPGQMWEEVGRHVLRLGGEIHLRHKIVGIDRDGFRVSAIRVRDLDAGSDRTISCSHFISTMPISELVRFLNVEDVSVAQIANELPYRDFITVGLLLRRMSGASIDMRSAGGMLPDNWIYIQEPDVKIGRLQIFNNWSPAMVADPNTVWLGLEYFCTEGDDIWSMDDASMIDFAASELVKIGLICHDDVLDGTLVRVPKAYPAYFGEYRRFEKIRSYLDQYPNLFPVGRNGMHRYNNQDHSMMAAKLTVDTILDSGRRKSQIWDVNTESVYHEAVDRE